MVKGDDCVRSLKSNYHTITTTPARVRSMGYVTSLRVQNIISVKALKTSMKIDHRVNRICGWGDGAQYLIQHFIQLKFDANCQLKQSQQHILNIMRRGQKRDKSTSFTLKIVYDVWQTWTSDEGIIHLLFQGLSHLVISFSADFICGHNSIIT